MDEGSPGSLPLRSPQPLHADEQPPEAAAEHWDAEMAEGVAYGSPYPDSSVQLQQQWSGDEQADEGGRGVSPGALGSPDRRFSPDERPQDDGQHPMEHDQLEDGQQLQQGYDLEEEAGAGSDDAAAAEQQRRLNELEAQLRQPDAVMEPGIMERLRDYVMANGHPQAAVEHLTDSYVGELHAGLGGWLACTAHGRWPFTVVGTAPAANSCVGPLRLTVTRGLFAGVWQLLPWKVAYRRTSGQVSRRSNSCQSLDNRGALQCCTLSAWLLPMPLPWDAALGAHKRYLPVPLALA